MDAGEPSRQRFDGTDLAGAVFRDVDLSGATITGLIGGLTINEVEVEPLITAELDRRHPERILLRSDDPDDLRQGWSLVRDQWTATIQRVEQLPPSLQRQRVDGEWSVLETLRHLVFVADDWFGRTVLAEPDPYWRAGLVPTFLVEFQPDGIDPSEDPDLAEILDRFDARVAQLDQVLSGLTADELVRECPASLSLGESTPVTVLTCVQMVLDEFAAHRRYAERDINTLAQ
jgi:uncharacterized damage-inducible protein DinB